jgi:ATP-binding cassette subfamily B (MDR/TAP) protein 1
MAKKYKRFATADFDIDPDAIPRVEEMLIIPRLDAAYAKSERQEEKELPHLASFREVFSFGSGPKKRVGLILGIMCAILSGCIYPALAFILATTLKTLSVPTSDDFLKDIRRIAFIFMGLGAFAFLSMTAQSTLLETAAGNMTFSLKTSWFDALLRQDMAYYDIKDVSGTATMISTAGAKYKAGVGRKLGEGVQFFVTFIGGFIYAFYASWRTSLILLAVVPVMSASVLFVVKMNQSQTKMANETYAEAGSIVYMAVSAIRTVFSLNACEKMIKNYANATERAYQAAASRVALLGLANGTVMGSMLGLRNVVLTLYGAYLLYDQVRNDGCDPSGNVGVNPSGSCDPDGAGVFGALIGITLGAAGLPQISVALEAFTHARASCQPAINVMNRKVGSDTDETAANALVVNGGSRVGNNRRVSMALPKYVINSSSQQGKKPSTIEGNIEFRNVSFAYPTRNESLVFDGFSLSVAAGQTVALVGASGCGKSTLVSLIERFYDPTSGSITIDGIDLRELNVRWLRDQIGLVSQEPVLFARSVGENIAYGSPGASREQTEEAAKLANARDFITSFPDGYSTHVGDLGSQLSGGQKQRIAISRAILKRAKILLLDEATSALDSESESVVQAALDILLESSSLTTIVIAHRLSTVRDADLIAVVDNGRVVEQGSHNELMASKGHYHRLVEAQSLSSHTESSATYEAIMEGRNDGRKTLVDTTEVESGMMDHAQQAHLVLRNVHFAYPTRKRNMVFSGLDLHVKRGETLAIVGPSGCGKSTVVSLIERFYDPISGTIELDGIDLKELNVSWLRDQIGLVQQEPTLFDATILENIRYGNPNATQDEVEAAARRANAYDFITAFPDQFNTYVGERGTQLSGGQKQRIAISRAILKPRQLLLLDEATSALDSESEHLVQDALDKLMKAKSQTAIVIAHRLSTLRNADRIAVIADGKVKEIGTHDELMSKPNGRFRRLSALQSLDGGDSEIKSLMAAAAKELEEKENNRNSVKNEETETEWEQETDSAEEDDTNKSNVHRARLLANDDTSFFAIGVIGALLSGLVFPACGVSANLLEFFPALSCQAHNFSLRSFFNAIVGRSSLLTPSS